ncbi:hypothetical protein OPQ81_002954 [Rhizoctonia solani]|nr:hypothetical protein OPQ81_002954 [Rhizoctonia solani]
MLKFGKSPVTLAPMSRKSPYPPLEGKGSSSEEQKRMNSHALRGSKNPVIDQPESDDYTSDGALSFDSDEITGFANASSRCNASFHDLFPNIPKDDYLIKDYECVVQRGVLMNVTRLDKKITVYAIPNAIQITTRTAKYTFASFLSRDTTYDVMHNIWRLSHPSPESASNEGVEVPEPGATGSSSAHKPTQCACGKEGKHFETIVMYIALPGMPERIYNLVFKVSMLINMVMICQYYKWEEFLKSSKPHSL